MALGTQIYEKRKVFLGTSLKCPLSESERIRLLSRQDLEIQICPKNLSLDKREKTEDICYSCGNIDFEFGMFLNVKRN